MSRGPEKSRPINEQAPDVVVDWKSDVNPSQATLEHDHAQVRAYLDITGALEGLIVLMTSGTVLRATSVLRQR